MSLPTYGPETTEFHREFAAQTGTLLRRRLLWFIAVWGGLGLLGSLPLWLSIIDHFVGLGIFKESLAHRLWGGDSPWLYLGTDLAWLAGYAAALLLALRRDVPRQHIVWISIALITLDGLFGVVLRAAGVGFPGGLFFFTVSHLVASIVFPWSARQAIIPAIIVLTISAASRLLIEVGVSDTGKTQYSLQFFAIMFSLFLPVPGCLIAWMRYSQRLGQHRLTFVQKRYGSLRQELAYARAIHESLFPAPRTGGTVCFTYKYEPMRQIGGDYLHASTCPTADGRDECLCLVLLDVTGHGIPAALTVNRLHGEIELLFADDPLVEPGRVLARLNRYVHLTLARHSIFVTALCLRVDPLEGTLEYASGGHPPAFLRAVDGTLNNLDSTAFVLGACEDAEFDPGQITIPFGPGDSLIAYTDGATEARTETGQMLRIEGMRRLLAEPGRVEPGVWPERLLTAVTSHRDGRPAEDDTLVVEIFRCLRDRPRAPKTAPAATAAATRPQGF
ncbi:MAG: serine/threonine-protein phosphatase [Phycisphaeraceae bacterium]|nr:MAG: serine/threonine-protein phosphatase [Phycisphaeraceae bacterium]